MGAAQHNLIVPSSVKRRAGIKDGDAVHFTVVNGAIVITRSTQEVPTKAELAAIVKGEAEIARGEFVELKDLLEDVARPHLKVRKKAIRKASR